MYASLQYRIHFVTSILRWITKAKEIKANDKKWKQSAPKWISVLKLRKFNGMSDSSHKQWILLWLFKNHIWRSWSLCFYFYFYFLLWDSTLEYERFFESIETLRELNKSSKYLHFFQTSKQNTCSTCKSKWSKTIVAHWNKSQE